MKIKFKPAEKRVPEEKTTRERKNKVASFSTSRETLSAIQQSADEAGISVSEGIRRLVEAGLKHGGEL